MRKRNDKTLSWLPERVYISRSGAYEYHPHSGGSKTIAPKGSRKSEVLQAYEMLFNDEGTVNRQYDAYRNSEKFINLGVGTKKDYGFSWDKLCPVFGHMQASSIKPHHIRMYMDIRGKSSKKRANVERIVLKNILSRALQYGFIASNPVDPVDPFPMKARDRYVTDAEYNLVYESAPEVVQIFMELAYICAARGQDIRKISMSDITEDGLLIVQAKTGKKQVKLWNNRLRSVVGRAKELRSKLLDKRGHTSMYLIVTARGAPYSAPGLSSIWNRTKRAHEGVDWTFHDLKAKGISDFEGDKQNFSGHKGRLQMERYNRSPDKTTVIDFN